MASPGGPHHGNGRPHPDVARGADAAAQEAPPRPTLTVAVRRRRADRAFHLRVAAAIRQNERALMRLLR
jgi:hypothetical protein